MGFRRKTGVFAQDLGRIKEARKNMGFCDVMSQGWRIYFGYHRRR
jgi:hypothetical protein